MVSSDYNGSNMSMSAFRHLPVAVFLFASAVIVIGLFLGLAYRRRLAREAELEPTREEYRAGVIERVILVVNHRPELMSAIKALIQGGNTPNEAVARVYLRELESQSHS